MAAPLRSRPVFEARTAQRGSGRPPADVVPLAELVPLADLVTEAARRSPGATAYEDATVRLTYRSLIATASATQVPLDDSGLTVALMMSVPGLASAGPSGLASTLARVRTRAVGALCSPHAR